MPTLIRVTEEEAISVVPVPAKVLVTVQVKVAELLSTNVTVVVGLVGASIVAEPVVTVHRPVA